MGQIIQQIFTVFSMAFIAFIVGITVGRKYFGGDPLETAVKKLGQLSQELSSSEKNRKVVKSLPVPETLLERKKGIDDYAEVLRDKALELERLANAHNQSVNQWWRDIERELQIHGDLRFNMETNNIELLTVFDGEKK